MEKELLNNRIELLEEDLESVHMYLDKLEIPRNDEKDTYSIVGRIKQLEKLDEKLHQRLIPYITDNFITIPRWEEGDFRPTLTFFQLPRGKSPHDCLENFKKTKKFIKEWFQHEDVEEWDYEIDDEYETEREMCLHSVRNSYSIKIHQKGFILDKDITPNYSILKLMKVAGDLIEDLNIFVK